MSLTSITKDFVVRSGFAVQGTNIATSSTNNTGTLQVSGGAGIAGNLFVGTTASIYGPTYHYGDLISYSSATVQNQLVVLNTATFRSDILGQGNLTLNGVGYFVNTQTALILTGGGLVNGLFTVTNSSTFSTATINGPLFANNTSIFNGTVYVTGTNSLTVGTGPTTLGGTLTVAGVSAFTNNTAADTGGNGAVKVTGGLYVNNNIVVGSTATSTANTNSNSLYTLGGLGVAKDASIGGNLVVTGSLNILGTQTVVNSTSTQIIDPVIDLGTGPNGSALQANDGYNKGLVIHYFDTQDNHMFLGRNNITGHLVLRNNIDPGYPTTVPNQDYVNSGSYATFDLGTLIANNTSDAPTTNSGAIQSAGGLGVALSAYVGNDVSGGTITARNLTPGRIAVAGANGTLVTWPGLSYNTSTNTLNTLVSYANTATNLQAGTPGAIPYQNAVGVTTFLPIGANSFVLTSNGSTPIWAPASGASVGSSTTASNISGGFAGAVPYQIAPGSTGFSSGFTWTNALGLLTLNNLLVNSGQNSSGAFSGALQVQGGAGISQNLYIGGNLVVTGTITTGGTDQITGNTGTFGTLNVTGAGTALAVTSNATIGGNLTATTLVVTSESILAGVTATSITGTSLTISGPSVVQSLTATTFTATSSNIIGNETVGGNFSVAGLFTATGQSTLGSVNATAITGTSLTITGESILAGLTATITTVTSLTVSGNETIGGNLNVSGLFTATGNAQLSGTVNVTGAATLNSTLNVTGKTTLAGLTATITTVTSFTVTGNETITGSSTINGSGTGLAVTNNATIGGNLTATTLVVTGQSTLQNVTAGVLTATSFTVSGNTALGNITGNVATFTNLTVSSEVDLGNLSVGGVFTSTGNATLAGNATVGSNLLVTGISTFTGKINIVDSTNAVATNVGSIVSAGGIGIAKDIYVGGAATIGVAGTGTAIPIVYSNNTLLASYTSGVISGNSPVNLDVYSSALYRTARYTIQLVDGPNIQISEMTLFHDGSNVYLNEYGVSTNNGTRGTFDANLQSGSVTLTFTPNPTATALTIKVVRLGITA